MTESERAHVEQLEETMRRYRRRIVDLKGALALSRSEVERLQAALASYHQAHAAKVPAPAYVSRP